MSKAARFKVDPKLASLLGEGYRSSEEALKELVDNAWDADAENVRVTLPGEVTADPIIVEDDGSGMTEQEIREEYLYIANDRRTRKGPESLAKGRKVKGRRGIGKFAGLIAADTMVVETKARGKLTRLRITKQDLLGSGRDKRDIENVDLPTEVAACPASERGTKITLSNLSQNLAFPSPDKLKQLLVLDYARQNDFRILVNGEPVTMDDIPGPTIERTADLPGVGQVRVKFKISEDKKALRQSGIAIRVGGKIVGRPTVLGLEEDDTIPGKLLKRVYGEIEADALADDVTADWGAIIENSLGLGAVKAWASEQLADSVKQTFKNEVNLQKARLAREVKLGLEKLPENRRAAAEQAIERVLEKFYGESEDRIKVVVGLMLEAFERDEYWAVLKNIDAATRSDVVKLAEALDSFGVVDLAVVAQQTKRRLAFLDELDGLVANGSTLEAQVHKAIEKNLWVLGPDYALISSNKTLERVIEDWAKSEFKGARANKRPDLFLAQDARQQYVLIEFKRPSHDITRDDEAQAEKYRDDLSRTTDKPIEVVLIGRGRPAAVSALYGKDKLRVTSYADILSTARTQLQWLLGQLGADSGGKASAG